MHFEELVETHGPMLVSYLCSSTRNLGEAEDLAQEAFLRVLHRWQDYRDPAVNHPALLRRIGKNLLIDRYRKRREMLLDDEAWEELDGFHAAMEHKGAGTGGTGWLDRAGVLRECLDGLDDLNRRICNAFYVENEATKSIASRLDLSQSAILKRLERLRLQLKACMERKLALGAAHG